MNYKDAGVDIEAGRSFVNQIKDTVKSTHRPEVMGGFGGFNGMMRIPDGYKKPILVSGTDGVGTKIHVAELNATGNPSVMQGIGIDLVAMCVNDVITCGAKPLYFLDYISLNRISPVLDDIMSGVIKGCELADVELIGGETAEHPMTFDIDLAGFSTGIVEQYDVIDGKLIKEGDIIIGIESSGIHSNGYSLINDLIRKKKLKVTEDLLTPTHIYTSLVEQLMDEVPILGMANITGGGIVENLPRCFPEGLKPYVDYNSWNLPEIFTRIMLAGEIPEEEMKRVFNLGIGYCIVIPKEAEYDAHDTIKSLGYKSWTIGKVVL